MPKVQLSGFADEIGPDPREQIAVLRETGVRHLELRGVWGRNVLDLSPPDIGEFRRMLADAGIGVSAIGSPIGKVQIRSDLDAHFDRFQIAVERARQFDTPNIRIFSFYHEGASAADCRDAVLEQLERMTHYAARSGCILLHENEKDIYGDLPERCRDLMLSISHPNLRTTFDPANFIQSGANPREDAWPLVSQYVDYFHIKDAAASSGKVVPAGHGDGGLEWILGQALAAGFEGFLSLEPHLRPDDPLHGGTGSERFAKAVAALRRVLDRLDVQVA
ncbi:MAG: sugar phosphate isomerase/epimerase [Gemmatimonadetes bacterium]|jgi:sugar phosphate isomerase/epimerase|nr:sugar phosphate isomerase/epimerase [Gemmatimonadota bacterium]